MQISSIYPKKNSSCKAQSIIEAFVCALNTARDSTEFFKSLKMRILDSL